MKDILEINKTYWSYYVELTNKGNRTKNYCGVFKCVYPYQKYK